jgi:hypothetical protein
MNRWKSFTLLFIAVIVIVGAIFLVRRLREPSVSEIERVFDGTEGVFVEGKDLLAVWRTLNQTDYWRSRTYEGLQELPPVQELLNTIRGTDAALAGRINIDAVMSAVGNESALGIYTAGASSRFLFVSRVDPNFLLVDRLLAFAGSDAGITVSRYREMRVKEAPLDERRSVLWALDGDLLLFSNQREIFYAALDRHIDGTAGGIVSNPDFRRMKKSRQPSRLISGYAVTNGLPAIRRAAEAFPDAARMLMPESLFFWASYADGVLTLGAKGTSGIGFFSLLPRGGKREALTLPEGVAGVVRAGRMPQPLRETADPPAPESGLVGLLPYLFPGGFSLFIGSDPQCGGGPGMIAVAESGSSTEAAIDRLGRLPGMTVKSTKNGGIDRWVLEKDKVTYLAWTERDSRTVVSNHSELLVGMPLENLETGGGLGYTTAQGEITLELFPRLMYRQLERCAGAFPIPSAILSLDQQRRLWAALYPAERIDGYASIGGNTLVIDIAIHVEDAIP